MNMLVLSTTSPIANCSLFSIIYAFSVVVECLKFWLCKVYYKVFFGRC